MNVRQLIDLLEDIADRHPVYIWDGNTRYAVEWDTGSVAGVPCVLLGMTDNDDDE